MEIPREGFWRSIVKSRASFLVFLVAVFCASAFLQAQNKANATEKPFASGGKIDMQLDGGSYEIRPAAGNHIRVTLNENAGNAKVELTTSGTHADVKVKDTPHNNFQATIEVPKAADLVVRLTGGNLVMAAVNGNKDVESYGGNVQIVVGDPNQYSSVDAAVKAGDIDAGVFGGSKSGLFQQFKWSGHGKYTLRAHLGAGNLELRSK
jgi:hypothetical protein